MRSSTEKKIEIASTHVPCLNSGISRATSSKQLELISILVLGLFDLHSHGDSHQRKEDSNFP